MILVLVCLVRNIKNAVVKTNKMVTEKKKVKCLQFGTEFYPNRMDAKRIDTNIVDVVCSHHCGVKYCKSRKEENTNRVYYGNRS